VSRFGLIGRDSAVPLGLLFIVGCMIVPLPTVLLDLLLCANLLFAVLLVIGALHVKDPLKVTALPSLLLIATLFRLSLNLATTRAVLSDGQAGAAVEAFGSVVIGGSVVVGCVLFLLITLIQFIVVAKGAERVAEVAARFTLDALPGKQMAIDAEIRSGLLDPHSARQKRNDIQIESRFYGALDGAMKFVKGDAIAGIVITAVNIVGGLLVGVLLHELEFGVAVRKYTVLTIGDGLLSQIPSLLNSVAAGLVVTRVQASEASTLASDLLSQLAQFRAARVFVASAAALLACLPGMPHLALLVVSVVAAGSLLVGRASDADESAPAQLPVFEPSLEHSVRIEVSREVVARFPAIESVSRALTEIQTYAFQRWGLVLQIPAMALWAEAGQRYRILVRGMDVAQGSLEGEENPLEAIMREVRTVIDQYRRDLIDDGATRRALDYVEKEIPELVTGVVPAAISLTRLTVLLRELLNEGITTRHLDVILQVLAERAGRVSDRELLGEIRAALAPVISSAVARDGVIDVAVLSPVLDLVFVKAEESKRLLPGGLVDALCEHIEQLQRENPDVVLLSSKRARSFLRDIARIRGGEVVVIAHEEVAPRYKCKQVAGIELSEEIQREALLQYAA
jgi:type III secretion protein V